MRIYNSEIDKISVNDIIGLFNNGICYVYGTINKWDGGHELFVSKKESLESAIEYAFSGGDINIIELDDNGKFLVQSKHHDGTNEFTIGLLTKKGIEKLERSNRIKSNEIKPYMVKKIKLLTF